MGISTAVDVSAVARVIGIKTKFINTNVGGVNILPQQIAVVGQGNSASTYDTTKAVVTSAKEVGDAYGYGSPLHSAVLQLLPANGDGVGSIPVTVFPLEDDDAGVAATSSITPTGTATASGTFRVVIGNVQSAQFTIAIGDTATEVIAKIISAVNGVLKMPVIASDGTTEVTFTSKWKGVTANSMAISITGTTDTGITLAIVQPSGGAANPDVTTATDQFGDVWYTMVVNCLDIDDSTNLDAYQTFGEGRWGALVRKPLVVFTGHGYLTPQEIVAITDDRSDDRVNVALANPGSPDMPHVTAAAWVSRIAVVANNNPARDYGRQTLDYIDQGLDGEQWNYTQRNTAVSGGASTVEVRDGVVNVSDTVTMYHPDGEEPPAYRYVCDIVKIQNIIYNVDLQFNTAEWDGAPLIPDDQPTVNTYAKKPKNARAVLKVLAQNLGEQAIISDISYSQDNTQCEIDSQNPKRLNTVFPVKVSGNVNIHSIDLNFGFYFGTSTATV